MSLFCFCLQPELFHFLIKQIRFSDRVCLSGKVAEERREKNVSNEEDH